MRTSSRREAGPAEGALDGQEGDWRPVKSAWHAAGEDNLGRHRERRPGHTAFDHGASSEGKRAHVVEPAAAWGMSPGQFSVVTVVILRATAIHAVVHGIGIDETVCGIAAMSEGQDRWWRHKAKGRENGAHHRRAKAKPSAECPHYALSVVGRRRCDKPRR
jgi:hypothetical protein